MTHNLYKENIIDHFKDPRNFGKINNPTKTLIGNNPLCGDRIKIQLVIKNKIIKDIKFTGEGCAISISSTSMFTEYIKGKNLAQLSKLNKSFMEKLIGVKISIGRIECLLLPLKTLKGILIDETKRS